MTDEPADHELNAYVDDELDDLGRFAVETHLSRNPALAARVMGDLSARTGLRILAAGKDKPHNTAPARAPSSMRAFLHRAVPAGSVGIAAALLVLVTRSDPPHYVDMAVASHRVAVMRASMVSQVPGRTLDYREIQASTRIVLPGLPADWNITDVQVFPAGNSPALLVTVRTGSGAVMSIFATRQKSDAPSVPSAVREGEQSVAFWRRGNMSYALTGEGDPQAIDQTAERLNESWS